MSKKKAPEAAAPVSKPPVSPEPDALDDAPDDALDDSAALEVLRPLREQLAPHAPAAPLRALFDAQITEATALEYGAKIGSDVVVGDATADLPKIADDVIARRVPGFGPAELSYTVDLAVALVTKWRALRDLRADQAAASDAKGTALAAALLKRTAFYNLLVSVTPEGSSERAALDKIGRASTRRLSAVAAALDSMRDRAEKRLDAAKHDKAFAAYLADKGLTAAKVAELAAPATEATRTSGVHGTTRTDVTRAQREVDVLDGRLRDQLIRLRRQVESARANGAALPEVVLTGIRHLGPITAPDEPPEPTPTPSPAPTPDT